MYSYFIQVMICYYHLFGYIIASYLASGALSSWFLCPFDMFSLFFEYFLHFSIRCSGLILLFPYLKPEISQISMEPWFLLLENGIEKPDPSARFDYTCVSSVRLTELTKVRNSVPFHLWMINAWSNGYHCQCSVSNWRKINWLVIWNFSQLLIYSKN